MTFDSNGNLQTITDPGGTTTYTWNARNQLGRISGLGMSASFVYDGVGRREKKTINSNLIEFLYDGLNPVQETSGANVLANILPALGIDEFLTRTDVVAGTTSHFLTDTLGSTIALADPAGAMQSEYRYEPFGNTTVSGTANTNSLQYTGRENDGTGLYYYRARYYRPMLQRFISEDPVEFAGGDVNLYTYVTNSPLNHRDPSGLLIAQAIGGGLGLMFGAYTAYANDPNASLGTIAQSAGVGLLAGTLSTTPIRVIHPLVASVVMGSIAGAFGNLGSQLLFPTCPGSIDVGSAWIAAVTGGFGGGVGAAVAGITSRQGFPILTKFGQDILSSSTSGIVAGVSDAFAQSRYQAAKTSGRKPQACQ